MRETEPTQELFIITPSNWNRSFIECDFLLSPVPTRILAPDSVLKLAFLPVKMVKNRINDKLRYQYSIG